jgi:hypothetical protein
MSPLDIRMSSMRLCRIVNPEGRVGGRLEKNRYEALGLLDDLSRGDKLMVR